METPKCNAKGWGGAVCEREAGHAKVVKQNDPREHPIGIPHKGRMLDGRISSWLDAEHCETFGCVYMHGGRCLQCGLHRDPVTR